MPASGPALTLSSVRTWDTDHLMDAATHWTTAATIWQDAFDHVHSQIPAPGGTPWVGDAADAALRRTGADQVKVLGVADDLRGAAAVARTGADDLHAAKLAVLAAVAVAESANFSVGDDFSVTDRTTNLLPAVQITRQAHAQALVTDIRARVGELIALDRQVAANIMAATVTLSEVRFEEVPVDRVHDPVQLVTNRFGPFAPPPEGPVICRSILGGFNCSEFLPGGGIYQWFSPVDVTGGWPD